MNKKVLLLILDGWGIAQNPEVSAIDKAKTPFIDSLANSYPSNTLRTDGLHVGLPEGQMGNSEVGHTNLGAGRIVYQDLVKINLAIENNTFQQLEILNEALDYAKEANKKVHFVGLVSDGGVHAHVDHLKALVAHAASKEVTTYVHGFTDGRDVAPTSGKNYLEDLVPFLTANNSALASVIGRYYAMDRDNRWERVQKAYDLLVKGKGAKSTNAIEAVEESYAQGITDEFLEPIVLVDAQEEAIATIEKDDVVVFFNYRTDRGRELTQALSQKDFPDYGMQKLDLRYITMTMYDERFENVSVLYPKDNLSQTLGEVISKAGKTQIRIAETEKYPHVTFFFSGGREAVFEGEKRLLCPSPKVATYDLQPEMSARDITEAILPEINKQSADFICLNFANTDMVGHTGVMEAAIKAAETVDACAKEIISAAKAQGYTSIVLADHGNSECMQKEDGSPHTAHTTYPVPVILVDETITEIATGALANIAPTVLKLMGIEQPDEMTENALI